MAKQFVLISTTRGDELRDPRRDVIAVSANRETLETMRTVRAKERDEWLTQNPGYDDGGIISSEEIEEVESV